MTRAPFLLLLAACADWSADGVQIDGDAAPLVRDMLRPWEGATQRPPRVRQINVTEDLLPGCYESCFDEDTETIWLDARLAPGRMNRALSLALGSALDDDGHGTPQSQLEPWTWYGSLVPTYAAERFSRAVGLGPVGVEAFPRASWRCDVTEATDDVRTVQRSVFTPPTAPIGPSAPIDRHLLLSRYWAHLPPEVSAGGVTLHGRQLSGRHTDAFVRIDIPSLDGDAVWVTYPDRTYRLPNQVALDPAGETSWAPGLGAELLGNYPVGDTEIAGAWLESPDPAQGADAPFVVVERARDGGEVLAVHKTTCPSRSAEWVVSDPDYGGRPVFVPTADGVWVISFTPGGVKMQRFGYGGEALEARTLLIDVESLYGGERFEFRW